MARPSTIHFELEGIAHLLSDTDLHVPVYQRSYAWGDEQITDYWTDLEAALDAGFPDYFLGTVVVADVDGTAVIIDGQQRLATTTILLAALRDAYAARSDESRAEAIHNKYIARFDFESATHVPRLKLNAEDQAFFDSVIIEGVSESAAIESHLRLLKAQKYFSNVLEEDLGAAGADWNRRIVGWLEFLDSNVKVMVIRVPEIADAFVIFETLNDRGAPLTISDLLRNYLMSKGRDAKGLSVIQEAWSQVLLNLGLQKEDSVFVDFLRQFWSSKQGAVREKELFSSIRTHVTTRPHALSFAKELPDASRHYAALLDSKHELWAEYSGEAQASVEALVRLDLGQYRPLALAVMEHFDEDEQVRTLRALVSWAVRGLVVGGVGGGVTERAYCTAAVRVRSGDLKTARQLMRQLLPIVPSDDEFAGAFARARISRPGVARYVMSSLERTARRRSNAELVDGALDNVRLQYVLPKSARPRDWQGMSGEEIKALVTRVGNLVLLADKDPELTGSTFAERQTVLAQSSINLTRALGEYRRWDAGAIGERQKELAERAVVTWPRSPRR